MINAIDTHYNGYKFRSRLEARWAVFLSGMGINYKYENEGYDLNFPETIDLPKYYLPDFEIIKPEKFAYHVNNIFVEIKPINFIEFDNYEFRFEYLNSKFEYSESWLFCGDPYDVFWGCGYKSNSVNGLRVWNNPGGSNVNWYLTWNELQDFLELGTEYQFVFDHCKYSRQYRF